MCAAQTSNGDRNVPHITTLRARSGKCLSDIKNVVKTLADSMQSAMITMCVGSKLELTL
jgi:hypothetical protein